MHTYQVEFKTMDELERFIDLVISYRNETKQAFRAKAAKAIADTIVNALEAK